MGVERLERQLQLALLEGRRLQDLPDLGPLAEEPETEKKV